MKSGSIPGLKWTPLFVCDYDQKTLVGQFLETPPSLLLDGGDDPLYPHLLPGRLDFSSCLLILNVTGLLLLFYYLPLADKAYLSVSNVTFVIPFGGFIRSLHYWAGQAMVVTVLLHMIRVFYYRAYRPPRSLNWLVGVGSLILTLILDFTGYVLRWDADTYSATVVGTQVVKQIPWVGSGLFHLLVGGAQFGETTVLRFYVLHCFLLPGGLFA